MIEQSMARVAGLEAEIPEVFKTANTMRENADDVTLIVKHEDHVIAELPIPAYEIVDMLDRYMYGLRSELDGERKMIKRIREIQAKQEPYTG